MARKIDAVLERVKEPESNLSVAQLGLVKRVHYNEESKKFYVFTNPIKSNHHYCCTIIQGLLVSGTLERLTEEFQKEFPDLSIEFVWIIKKHGLDKVPEEVENYMQAVPAELLNMI